jgi:hypothetical protein
MLSLLAK